MTPLEAMLESCSYYGYDKSVWSEPCTHSAVRAFIWWRMCCVHGITFSGAADLTGYDHTSVSTAVKGLMKRHADPGMETPGKPLTAEQVRSLIRRTLIELGIEFFDIDIRSPIMLDRKGAVYWVLNQRHGISLSKIGKALDRNHTSILHSLQCFRDANGPARWGFLKQETAA
jgi:hypothetical protein